MVMVAPHRPPENRPRDVLDDRVARSDRSSVPDRGDRDERFAPWFAPDDELVSYDELGWGD
jgi:hypothetical protein